jgi:hypothetical protein
MTKIAILFAVMACAHTAPTSVLATSTPAADPPPPQVPPTITSKTELENALTVRMQLRARRGRKTFDVAPDETLQSNDYVELRVVVNVKAYVYVVQLLPGGNSNLLFPDAGDIMFVPGVSTRIPFASNDWYQLDDDLGTETIYVVASREPIAEIAETLRDEIRAISDIATATPIVQPTPLTVQQATPGPGARLSKVPPRSARPRRMLTMANRGLRKVVTIDGRSRVDTVAPVQEDGLVVAWFSFHHAP